jgi:hypothetical protein
MDAYSVRSAFAHGNQLSDKERASLNSKYGNIEDLLLAILDYLRLSLVTTIFFRGNQSKEDLIHLLDDALISKSHQKELESIVLPVQDLTKSIAITSAIARSSI